MLLTIVMVCLNDSLAAGNERSENTDVDKAQPSKRLLVIPYPFYNDTIGMGVGVASVLEGYIQPQALSVASALFSDEGTYLLFFMLRNYQVPWMKRLFFEPSLSFGEFKEIKYFGGYNADFPNQRPGSNNSDKDNFSESDGSDLWCSVNFKYLLPIGHGKAHILPQLKLDDGILVSGDSGGGVFNPLKSGRTYFEIEPFLRKQDVDDLGITQKTAGVEIALTYDNTDFWANPGKGNYLRLFFDRDWGAYDDSTPWSVAGGEFSQYFHLTPTETARHRVLAVNFWTVDSLTWNSSHMEDGEEVFHRPPTYKGANLGGLWRLRGYPATRFNDRAGIYYGLEYRHTLAWNPLKDLTLGGRLDVDWFQLVGFGELGRVAPQWDIGQLHEDMKWSTGIGLRIMANHIVVRADLAASEEGMIWQLFIGQPWPKR